jgi:hypothetical protein
MMLAEIRQATGANAMAQTNKKLVRVRTYTRTIDGEKIKVGAIKRPPVKQAGSSKHSASNDNSSALMGTPKLMDALKTPLQSGAIALGWHVIHDGNVWCAVGPIFEDLLVSPAGWGSTPEEARVALTMRHQRDGGVLVPLLPEFRVWG